uniref:Uncharacterized protein n=1 Tax=Aegilops tauschii subsp. strangulata TaxID=200361 RepID=A0A453NYX5_AEGTS
MTSSSVLSGACATCLTRTPRAGAEEQVLVGIEIPESKVLSNHPCFVVQCLFSCGYTSLLSHMLPILNDFLFNLGYSIEYWPDALRIPPNLYLHH